MAEQEQEKKPETPENPQVTALWDRLTKKAADRNMKRFEFLIGSDNYTFNGYSFKFRPVSWKNKPIVDKLRVEAADIDQDKEWEKYAMNVRDRACILIEGMTPEKFDEGDYNTIENVVSAWSVRAIGNGFRDEEQSVPGVL